MGKSCRDLGMQYNEGGIIKHGWELLRMKRISIKILLFAALSLILLNGCVSMVQEVTVHEDGSGTLRFALGVETASYEQFTEAIPEELTLENLLANTMLDEGVVDVQREEYESEGRKWEAVQIEVGDMADFLSQGRSIGPLVMTIDADEDGSFSFMQTLDLEEFTFRVPGIYLMDVGDAEYTLRLITPQIVQSNGVHEAVGTSVWENKLRTLIQSEDDLFVQADYVLEPYEGLFIPWDTFYSYVVIGFLAVGAISILVVIIVNTRRKAEEDGKIQF